jgi:hypothetical protein
LDAEVPFAPGAFWVHRRRHETAFDEAIKVNRHRTIWRRGDATCSPDSAGGNSHSPRGLANGIVRAKNSMTRVGDNVASELAAATMARDRLAKRPHQLFRCLISFLFLGLVSGGTAARASAENLPATSLGPGLTFAIADFDGDRRPDFASIQAGQNRSGSSDYSIQIYLSQVGRQSIDLVAPVGGLLIEARDVDGDHAVDLIVSTAWRKRPVAIFLNDGHGTFSRAEVAAFPGAFSEYEINLVSGSNPATDALGISPKPGAGICPEENDSAFDRSSATLILASTAGVPRDPFQTSYAGRAPPSEVHHS